MILPKDNPVKIIIPGISLRSGFSSGIACVDGGLRRVKISPPLTSPSSLFRSFSGLSSPKSNMAPRQTGIWRAPATQATSGTAPCFSGNIRYTYENNQSLVRNCPSFLKPKIPAPRTVKDWCLQRKLTNLYGVDSLFLPAILVSCPSWACVSVVSAAELSCSMVRIIKSKWWVFRPFRGSSTPTNHRSALIVVIFLSFARANSFYITLLLQRQIIRIACIDLWTSVGMQPIWRTEQ